MYGLKQGPQVLFKRLYVYLLTIGFTPSKTNVSLFIYSSMNAMTYLLVYVDDILVVGSDTDLVTKIINRLTNTFKIRDLRNLSFFFEFSV